MNYPSTTSGMMEDGPFPIETIEVNDAEMAQLALDYIAAVDKTPYVVNNVQDPNNKTYHEWTGTKWVPWNSDLNQGNRYCIPDDQIETFALGIDVDNMGAPGEPIVFTNPDILGYVRLVPDANNWDITGILAPAAACPNKIISIQNLSVGLIRNIRFMSNNAGSLAVNRFLFQAATEILAPQETIKLMYNQTLERWLKI